MNKDSLEEMGELVMRMRKIVEGDPDMPVRINRAVSSLEAVVRDHMEDCIWRMYRESRNLEAE